MRCTLQIHLHLHWFAVCVDWTHIHTLAHRLQMVLIDKWWMCAKLLMCNVCSMPNSFHSGYLNLNWITKWIYLLVRRKRKKGFFLNLNRGIMKAFSRFQYIFEWIKNRLGDFWQNLHAFLRKKLRRLCVIYILYFVDACEKLRLVFFTR